MPFVAENREDKRYVLLDFEGSVTHVGNSSKAARP